MRIPWYDRDKGMWVDKEDYENEHKNQVKESDDLIEKANYAVVHPESAKKPDIVDSMTIQEEDLPF